ncbi:MAG TPA: PepSY domain-containing protein [Steroidobacteraceae bacterium]|nr:PepSY domain-containing protein [Steroidobacteraceae bacterium]
MSSVATRTNRKKPIFPGVSRKVLPVHRWLGITLGLLFALWFASGIILSFVPFPTLATRDRISASEAIDLEKVQVSPAAALAGARAPAGAAPVMHLRLISVAGHPRYVFSPVGRPVQSVSAETGQALVPVSVDVARTVAEQFSAEKISRIDGPFEYDQWTVHERYGPYRPLYKISLADAAGTCLYVSLRSGEVIQRTRRAERAWNWVGAVVHWINPTLLRKHQAAWRWTVWSVALLGILLTVAGIWLGVVRYLDCKRLRRPGISPFTGWLGWHHSIGLFAAAFVLTWISSGWLTVDRGTLFSRDEPTMAQLEDLRGVSLAEAARDFPALQLRKLRNPREIEVTAVGGQPFLVVRDAGMLASQLMSVGDTGTLHASRVIPDELLLSAAKSAWSTAGVLGIQAIAENDAYRVRSNPLPDTARRIVLNDRTHTWIQIDAASGQIISVTDASRRLYRWLVDGLHCFDFPLFNHAEPLRHTLILLAATTGLLFCSTGVAIGLKRLRRSLS